jgi:hypothetical protein
MRETRVFLNSLRDSFLVSGRFEYVVKNDSLAIRNYLSNKPLFGNVILADDRTGFPLDKAERMDLVRQFTSDTSKIFIKNGFIRKTKLVSKTDTVFALQLSSPIFFRKYNLCVLSIGDRDENYTFIFRRINRSTWTAVRRIGGVFASD